MSPTGDVVSTIVVLLFRRGPTAVRRLVVAVDIDPVDRMACGRLPPHVSQEGFETALRAFALEPPIADRDAATAVPGERFVPWVEASLLHLVVAAVLSCHPAARGVAVGRAAGTQSLKRQAATALCDAGKEVAPHDLGLGSAITGAAPKRFSVDLPQVAHCDQSAKTMTLQVTNPGRFLARPDGKPVAHVRRSSWCGWMRRPAGRARRRARHRGVRSR